MLVPIEKNKVSFNQLLDAISAEVQDIESLIPDINNIQQDIAQIYADIEAQLIGYSTDITKLSANEIENTIKDINEIYLKNSELEKYSDKSGYRIVNVGINNENVKMVEHQNVPFCMKRISEDIQELVQSASKMNKDDYLKRAVQLNYRFIRIHPFVDSNGRTSRALLNMMTIPKGMLIEVPKERKNEFIKAQRESNKKMDKQGYFELLNNNREELKKIEKDNTELPVYNFVKQNCVVEFSGKSDKNTEQTKNITKQKILPDER